MDFGPVGDDDYHKRGRKKGAFLIEDLRAMWDGFKSSWEGLRNSWEGFRNIKEGFIGNLEGVRGNIVWYHRSSTPSGPLPKNYQSGTLGNLRPPIF